MATSVEATAGEPRLSPVSRRVMLSLFFFGAPIREYLLLATTLPYSALCAGFGAPSAHGLIQLLIALIATACAISRDWHL